MVTILIFPGLFFSVVFSSLVFFYCLLLDDKEKKTYRLIQSLYSKGITKNMVNPYYSDYIKTKMAKIKMKNKSIMAYLFASIQQERNKEKYLLQVRSSLKIPITLLDFCEKTNKIWTESSKETQIDLLEIIDIYNDFLYFALKTLDELHDSMMNYYKTTNQLVNMCYMIILCGGKFVINDFDSMKGYRIITMKNYVEKYRELEVKRCDLNKESLQCTIDSDGELSIPYNHNSCERELIDIRNISNLINSEESDSIITDDDSNLKASFLPSEASPSGQ